MDRCPHSRYEPFLIEVTENDPPFEDAPITKVVEQEDGWLVTADSWTIFCPNLDVGDGWGMSVKQRDPIVPKVGDRFRLYGAFGYEVQGMQVNNDVVFYRDAAQREAKRRRWLEDHDAQKKRRFVLGKAALDREYADLPEFFKARIDRFRAEDPKFRYDSEAYEMFCCTEAVKIATHLEPQLADTDGKDVGEFITEIVKVFRDHWDDVTNRGVVSDTHSNNTFGGACRLAAAYLRFKAGLGALV